MVSLNFKKPLYIVLQTSEGQLIKVNKNFAKKINVVGQILSLLKPANNNFVIPLYKVTCDELQVVFKWIATARDHYASPIKFQNDLKHNHTVSWISRFMKPYFDNGQVYALMNAADYLGMDNFLLACCRTMAAIMNRSSVQEIHIYFRIPIDASCAELRKVQEESIAFADMERSEDYYADFENFDSD